MSSKWVALAAFAAAFSLGGCGKFGSRDDGAGVLRLEASRSGCLDSFGDRLKQYFRGEADPAAWRESWDCVSSSLEHFTTYVKGAGPGGYTPREMRDFANAYLFRNAEASDRLMEASFSLKAGMLGGSASFLTHAEIERLRGLITVARDALLDLLPVVRNAVREPGSDSLLALADGLAVTGERVGRGLGERGGRTFETEEISILLGELGRLFEWDLPLDLLGTGLAFKALALGTKAHGIESAEWPEVFGFGGRIVGLAAAAKKAGLGDGPFLAKLAPRIEALLAGAPERHGGAIATESVSALFAGLPERWREWGALAGPVKRVVTGGSLDRITGVEWRRFLSFLRELSEPARRIALGPEPGPREAGWVTLLEGAAPDLAAALLPVVSWHGGAIPMENLDAVIAAVPEGILDAVFGPDVGRGELSALARSVKRLLAAGSPETVTEAEWSSVLGTLESASVPALRLVFTKTLAPSGANGVPEHVVAQIEALEAAFAESFRRHGGRLPAAAFDSLVDAFPETWLTLDRALIKQSIRPLFEKVLLGGDRESISLENLRLVRRRLAEWVTQRGHLHAIFGAGIDARGVGAAVFSRAAAAYATGLDPTDRAAVDELILVANTYKPLFAGSDAQITFAPLARLSLHHLESMLWMRRISAHLLRAYSSLPQKDRGTLADLTRLLDDFDELGYAFRILRPRAAELAWKRFREADLFTFSSDGDGVFGLDEAVYYLAFIMSSKALSRRMLHTIEAACHRPELGDDSLGWGWMDIECFRREFYSEFRTYWDYFPRLIRYWESIGEDRRSEVIGSIEAATRECGVTGLPIASHDVEALSGMFQYVEALFARFDDGDDRLETPEALEAFGIFRRTMGELLDKDPDEKEGMLRGVFTYMLRYGHPPEVVPGNLLRSIPGAAHFISWQARRSLWNVQADRGMVFQVFASLARQAAARRPISHGECVPR